MTEMRVDMVGPGARLAIKWGKIAQAAVESLADYVTAGQLTTALEGKVSATRTISAGTGLTGGGDLTANRSFALSAGSIASLVKADSALQPGALSGYVTTAALTEAVDDASAAVTAVAIDDQPRPGDAPAHFTATLTGAPSAGAAAPGTSVAVSEDGTVRRLTGTNVITTRPANGLLVGHTYKARAVVRRTTDPTDPAGDTVRVGVQWLNSNKAQISQRIIADVTLTVAMGLQTLEMDFAYGTEDFIPWPATARYARPFIETYGSNGVTSVVVLEWKDITDAGTSVTPPLNNYQLWLADGNEGTLEDYLAFGENGLQSIADAVEFDADRTVTAASEVDNAFNLNEYLPRDGPVGEPIVRNKTTGRWHIWITPEGKIGVWAFDASTVDSVGDIILTIPAPSQSPRDGFYGVSLVDGTDGTSFLRLSSAGALRFRADDWTVGHFRTTMDASEKSAASAFAALGLGSGYDYRGIRLLAGDVLATVTDLARAYEIRQIAGASVPFIDSSLPVDVNLALAQSNTDAGAVNAVLNVAAAPHSALRVTGTAVGLAMSSSLDGAAFGNPDLMTGLAPAWPNTKSDYATATMSSQSLSAYFERDLRAELGMSDPGTIIALSRQGGRPLTDFLPGTSGRYIYENLMSFADAIPGLATASLGRAVNCALVTLEQGEGGPTSSGAWLAALESLLDDDIGLLNDVQTRIGQASPPSLGIVQTNSDATSDAAVSNFLVNFDQFAAGMERDDCILIGPSYMAPLIDENYVSPTSRTRIHHNSIGRALVGEMKAFAKTRFQRDGDWAPLHPISAALAGDVVTVDFAGPEGPWNISLDTGDEQWVPSISGYGVNWIDSLNTIAVASAQVTGRWQIQFTLASTPNGAATNQRIRFGCNSAPLAGWSDRRTQIMIDTGIASPARRLLTSAPLVAALPNVMPRNIRLYCAVCEVAAS